MPTPVKGLSLQPLPSLGDDIAEPSLADLQWTELAIATSTDGSVPSPTASSSDGADGPVVVTMEFLRTVLGPVMYRSPGYGVQVVAWTGFALLFRCGLAENVRMALCLGQAHVSSHPLAHDAAALCTILAHAVASNTRTPLASPCSSVRSQPKPLLPGVATGLAWTPNGGEVLFVEATVMPGTGKVLTTGRLGDVMKESASIAVSWLRANAVKVRRAE